jgi:zinc protease
VFADVVKNPSFPDMEVKDMKERIGAAIESQDRDWFAGGNRYFRSVFYGPSNNPYQFTALGTKEGVEKLTPEQVRQWYADKVLNGKKVLAIYGDIDPAAAMELVSKHFGAANEQKSAPRAEMIPPEVKNAQTTATPSVTVDDVKVQKWDNPESVVFIGFKSASLVRDTQRDPLIMADTLTSGFTYPTGYIFETLRGLGLVYDANAQNHWGLSQKYPGTFWAYAACDAHNVDACIDQMLLHIARLQGSDQDIDVKWFGRAQNLVATADAMDHETAAQQAAEAALDELYGLGYDYHAKFAERIKAVTIDQVRQVAKTRLRNCVIAVSTDKPELVKAKAGTREYKSFPPVDLTPKGVQHDSNSAGK